ncbi:hypothetical protein Cgig2_018219 [Carnegiea gigantea]|uniref:Uncharacterized protein n=1 Tax=Carnegiea gigantea TaxID=171969 RepID=A0A9Q1KYV0_9CARY|nr:hypothetical protein Cgig2_018219 [Carnegiea gigantea]
MDNRPSIFLVKVQTEGSKMAAQGHFDPTGIMLAKSSNMKAQGEEYPNTDSLNAMEDDEEERMGAYENAEIFLNLGNIEDVEISTDSSKRERMEERFFTDDFADDFNERYKAPIKRFSWVRRLTCFGNEELNALEVSEGYYPSKADVLTAFGPRQLKKIILLFNLFDNELPIGYTTMRKVILPDTIRQYVSEQYQRAQPSTSYEYMHHIYIVTSKTSFVIIASPTSINDINHDAYNLYRLTNKESNLKVGCVDYPSPMLSKLLTLLTQNYLQSLRHLSHDVLLSKDDNSRPMCACLSPEYIRIMREPSLHTANLP